MEHSTALFFMSIPWENPRLVFNMSSSWLIRAGETNSTRERLQIRIRIAGDANDSQRETFAESCVILLLCLVFCGLNLHLWCRIGKIKTLGIGASGFRRVLPSLDLIGRPEEERDRTVSLSLGALRAKRMDSAWRYVSQHRMSCSHLSCWPEQDNSKARPKTIPDGPALHSSDILSPLVTLLPY